MFQVITGGQYDVDVKVEGPNKQIIYQQQKMQYDSYQFTSQQTGNRNIYIPLMLLILLIVALMYLIDITTLRNSHWIRFFTIF